MDGHAPTAPFHTKREDSASFIRLIRNNRNDETLKRVCQHLSVLVAVENKSPRPKSRNGPIFNETEVFPPNNTPAEGAAPPTSYVKMNRGKENWKRLSSVVVKRFRVANALPQNKRDQHTGNFVVETIDDINTPTAKNGSSLVVKRSSMCNLTHESASSIVTVNHLYDEIQSISNLSKLTTYEKNSKDDDGPVLNKSVWQYFQKSVDSNDEQGPSGAQNIEPTVARAKNRWHILSRTILTLVRAANVLNLLKAAPIVAEYSTPASIDGSVIIIKPPNNYNDSVSSGSFTSTSGLLTPFCSGGTESSTSSEFVEDNWKPE